MKMKYRIAASIFALFLCSACVPPNTYRINESNNAKAEKTIPSYEQIGYQWGKELQKGNFKPGDINQDFVNSLNNYLDYFKVHSDLKDAFKKGFRLGYEDRVADLVLGPHLQAAAGKIGEMTSGKFVKVIEDFETGWGETLRSATEVFIVLISEGSQADREVFVNNFVQKYLVKYEQNKKVAKAGSHMKLVSEGGTVLYIDMSRGVAGGALDIPSPEALKNILYQQAFTVMGDELGRRLSSNLIKRDEIIDILRRCKPALNETKSASIDTIKKSFVVSYGTDADEVFDGIIKDAGLRNKK